MFKVKSATKYNANKENQTIVHVDRRRRRKQHTFGYSKVNFTERA